MPKQPVDPYAPPPMHHDHSGALVRFVIIAAMLGAAAWGYMTFSGTEQQSASLVPEQQQEQQVADATDSNGYRVSQQDTFASPPPAATPAPAPATRPATPAPAQDAVPPPSTTTTPSAIDPSTGD